MEGDGGLSTSCHFVPFHFHFYGDEVHDLVSDQDEDYEDDE